MIEYKNEGEDLVITFNRRLDETVQFQDLKPRLSQRILFDCHQLEIITSAGLQKWILWIRGRDPRLQYVFRGCHSRVVEALNQVRGFAPQDWVVESFYWPFHCSACGHEEEILLERGKHYIEAGRENARFLAPDMLNCPKCREPMEVAILESQYLQFLHAQKTTKE